MRCPVLCASQAEELATAAAAAAAAIAEISSAASSDNEQSASANGGDGVASRLAGRRGKRKPPQRTHSAPSMVQAAHAERRPHSPSPLSRPPLERCDILTRMTLAPMRKVLMPSLIVHMLP